MRLAVPLQPGFEAYPGCKLLQRLGEGGFAEVWQAQTKEGAFVALKFLPCENSQDAITEIRSLQAFRKMRHPHIITIYGIFSHAGYNIVAMEQADGSLADLLDVYQSEYGTPLPAEQIYLLLSQAAEALDYLNTRQHILNGKCVALQHCDVKPSNLLLVGDTVKVTDFGLTSPISCQLTFHRRAGTLAYTAPEVFQGRLSHWTDQFSLAVTFYELRTGKRPFAQTPRDFQRGYTRPAPDLSLLPEEERPVVARALAPIPQDRWPTCRDFVEQLAPMLAVC